MHDQEGRSYHLQSETTSNSQNDLVTDPFPCWCTRGEIRYEAASNSDQDCTEEAYWGIVAQSLDCGSISNARDQKNRLLTKWSGANSSEDVTYDHW